MKRRLPPGSGPPLTSLPPTASESIGHAARSGRMDPRFAPLATYNAERARGILHTPEWRAEMATLQAEWDGLRT